MTNYTSFLKEMSHEQKEAIFLGHLKSQLLSKNFIVATPEPDLGDNIWFANNHNKNYEIYPAQIKSAYMYQWIQKNTAKRYVLNVKSKKFEATLNRKFYYIIGLYDPDHITKFHIGCIPSSFFLENWSYLSGTRRITAKNYHGADKQRINLHIEYSVSEQQYYAFVKPLVNVTHFFNGFNEIP